MATLMVGVFAATPASAQTAAGGGASHTVILTADGTVWTVGAIAFGQLGDSTTTMRTTPVQVGGLTGVVAVAAGSDHSLALTSTGALYVWGYNGFGAVGDGSTINRSYPVQSNLSSVVAIAAGEFHSVALTATGEVYTWGRNTYGQLGNGSTTQANAPVLVATGAVAIGAGHSHTLIVKTDGTVHGSGRNSYGALGDGTVTQRTSLVPMIGIATATAVDGGSYHSVILLADGSLKAVGYNGGGELGDGTTTARTSPVPVSGLTGVTTVSAGAYHTLARKADGSAWGWGYNAWGQVGDGTTTLRTSPITLTTLPSVTGIAAGVDHSIAVSSTGVVFTWGRNTASQLGDGTTVTRLTPTPISEANYAWKVSSPVLSQPSGTFNVNLNVTITVATAGATIRYTQTGTEPTEADLTVASGGTVVVTASQTLKAKAFKTGQPASNTESATYLMQVGPIAMSPSASTYTTPQSVSMTSGTPGTTIRYTTDGSTPAVSSTVYSGAVSVATSTTLKAVGFKTDWTDSVVTSRTYTMNFGTLAAPVADQATGTYTNSVTVALSAMSGATLRYTIDGTVPQSSSTIYTAPLTFEVTKTLKAKAYHPDYTTSADTSRTYTLVAAAPALSPTAGTYAAGQQVTVTSPSAGTTLRYSINSVDPTTSDPTIASGASLVLGNYTLKVKAWKTGATASAVTVAAYAVTGDLTAPAIAAGNEHSLAIRPDGVSWGWGMNGGQVGDGTTVSPRLLPRIVSGLTGAVAVAAGRDHSLEVLNDGTAVGFGYNANGRLGDGTTSSRTAPVLLAALSGMVALSGGADHSLGLTGDGSVLAWGANNFGQIGDGTATERLSPTSVSSLVAVAAIAGGYQYSLAVRQDGTIWAWGRNAYGQLGDGTTTNRLAPVPLSGIATATAISAGQLHSLAALADGTVRVWGRNDGGFLGAGTTPNQPSPVAVPGLTDVVAVAAGGTLFSIALKSDGTVWAWGSNGNGQLADGTTTNRTSAAQVSGLSGIVKIAAGSAHVLALAEDGTVYGWGRNAYGQLGDGTTTNRLTPTVVSGPGMNWKVATPIVSVASGLYFATQGVVVTMPEPDATLRYTTTGVDPTGSDAIVESGGTIVVSQSQTLKVSGWKAGAVTSIVVERVYELKVVAPTMSPGAGAYGSAQNVVVGTTTSGATLSYTLDGTEPSTSSPVYTSALAIADTLTLKARASKTGWTPSDSGHASYSISGGTVATPIVTPAGGSQTTPPLVSMSTATTGATLRYTLDGSTPTAAASIFTYPFLVPVTTTVKVKAFKAGYTASATTTVTYGVDATGATATPTIVPSGGWYAVGQTVTITGPSGATLRYTSDGSDPITSSTSITSGNALTIGKSQVLKVRAWASGLTESAVRRADFVITGAVAAGASHSLALAADGTVWAFGWDFFGQLGNGASGNTLTPTAVLTGAIAIAAGDRHSLAVKADGTVWGWGEGGSGRLGNGSGTTSSFHTPAAIASFTNAVAVAAGYQHSLALKSDGTVWAFGSNVYGQLGDATTSARTVPVQVTGLTGIVAIAIGRGASYALQKDGAGDGIVWAWGRNEDGELGDGSTLSRTTPTRVTGLPGVTQIASGMVQTFGIALGADGRVYGWGKNDKAQLGNSNTADHTSATTLPVIAAGRLVGAGSDYGLAVDGRGRAWAWGDATTFALGVGPTAANQRALVPERSDVGGVLGLAAGDNHTLAMMPDGTVRGFGANNGKLGNGLTATSEAGVVVSGLTLADNTWLAGDSDGDDLATWREYLLGTDPLNPDSNGNGVMDGHDDASGASAADPDSDDDGVPNWSERANGTDPFRADTDGDSVSDLNDAFPLDPTRSMAPSSNPADTTPPMVTLKAPVSARPVP